MPDHVSSTLHETRTARPAWDAQIRYIIQKMVPDNSGAPTHVISIAHHKGGTDIPHMELHPLLVRSHKIPNPTQSLFLGFDSLILINDETSKTRLYCPVLYTQQVRSLTRVILVHPERHIYHRRTCLSHYKRWDRHISDTFSQRTISTHTVII